MICCYNKNLTALGGPYVIQVLILKHWYIFSTCVYRDSFTVYLWSGGRCDFYCNSQHCFFYCALGFSVFLISLVPPPAPEGIPSVTVQTGHLLNDCCGCCTYPNHHSKYWFLSGDGAINTFILISSLCFTDRCTAAHTYTDSSYRNFFSRTVNFVVALYSMTFACVSAYMFHVPGCDYSGPTWPHG